MVEVQETHPQDRYDEVSRHNYRRFVENLVTTSVLTLAVNAKAPRKVKWTPVMEEVFYNLKVSLCKCCILNVLQMYLSSTQMHQVWGLVAY